MNVATAVGLTAAPVFAHAGGGIAALLGPLGALGSSLTWAYGSSIYAREARRVGAVEVNLARAVIVLPLFVMCAALLPGEQGIRDIGGDRLLWLCLSVVCSYGVGDLLFYLAAIRLTTSTALAIASVSPVWAVLAGVLSLGEVVSPARAAGTACCIAGVAWLVLLRPGSAETEARSRKTSLVGVALAVAASLFWAGNTYTTRRGASGLPLFLTNAIRYAVALLMLGTQRGLIALKDRWGTQGKAKRETIFWPPRRLLAFSGTALIEAFFGSSIFVYGLSHTDLSVAAPLVSLSPLFAVPIGLMLGTEMLDLRRICAICVTVAGVVLLVA